MTSGSLISLPPCGEGRTSPLSRNKLLRFQGRSGTPGVFDGHERRGCWEHAHASGGRMAGVWSSRPRDDGRDSAVATTRPQPSARRRRSDWVRSAPSYPLSITGLAPRNWVRSARRMRFAWRAWRLGKSSLTGRTPRSCNHERWSASRPSAGSFVRRGSVEAPAEHFSSGSDLTLHPNCQEAGGLFAPGSSSGRRRPIS